MTDHYQVTVVGGGPAGLTAALYTTRLGHDTAVINRGGGRAAMMLDTHNVIGVTEETSGNEFLAAAIEQVQSYGADYFQDYVSEIEPIGTDGEGYRVTAGNVEVTTDHIVLATGFSDVRPDPPLPRTGKGLHYCLHCDAYMFVDESVFVMGTGDAAAHVAMIMLNFTPDVDILTRGDEIEWSDETAEMLENHPIDVVHDDIVGIRKDDDGWLSAFEFEDGSVREYRGGFPMYGSNYNTDLAESLGVELNDDGTIAVDDHGRTNVDGVYAVGDITPGHNQIPTAMGEGARCGIGNHYDLRAFPRGLDEIEELGPVTDADVPAISQELLRRAVTHEGHPGGPREQQSVAGDD
ncbi:NAD(P)/FAD-dependent oxidoreductase [Natronomonas salsuginis]|jgi:thioredoxin reductase (NADPH)|uniref:Thioredoxin-disulfide reductase n=1 Tax=Natronomonas salsuginis TaxID=2217661 RepID=A0A4U5JAU2_9EURY|nr:NAD(P)/FAD-dependent oxidoreductase [Natronomonas salsuginis]TKR26312.1 thioredoxin-disulfide reductase [Natronomonas salsuginis]